MNDYLIVADDFTGANDTGVQLKRRGVPTSVVFDAGMISPGGSFVLDTESRALGTEDAYRAVHQALQGVDLAAFRHVIKKVDSTLRGSVAQEIKAMDDLYGAGLVIFAPALPDLGRTTVGGVHHLMGVPIARTELSRDPKTPVAEDNITRMLQTAYPNETVRHVPLRAVEADAIDFSAARLYTCDAVTNSDLQSVIRAAIATGKRVLWVGTAALADHLLGLERRVAPALAVVASVSSVSGAQVRYAVKEGAALVRVPIPDLLEENHSVRRCAEEALDLLRQGRDVLLVSSASCDRSELDRSATAGVRLGLTMSQVSCYTQKTMGALARSILDATEISGLLLTGGDTAIGFFKAAESLGSSIVTEIAVGIPMMRLAGGPHAGLRVVTKAGAFGKEDAITFSLRKLKEVTPL